MNIVGRIICPTSLGCGLWLGILATLGLPYTAARPATWKRHSGLWGADKEHARLRAQQLFPAADLRRKKDHGRAEALLLARYGQHQRHAPRAGAEQPQAVEAKEGRVNGVGLAYIYS